VVVRSKSPSSTPTRVTLKSGAVAQHGEQYAKAPMRYSYDRGLVTAPRADPGEVRVQGMDGTACVVRRLA